MSKNKIRVSIITLNEYRNYGNRLQLFALSRVLSGLGLAPEVYWPKKIKYSIKYFIKYRTPALLLLPKERKLKTFTEKYIAKQRRKCNSVVIIGSDQVWNPDYYEKEKYLLNGASGTTIVSYAASIGRDVITNSQKRDFIECLEKYKNISVREASAKRMLEPLVGEKKIEVVLDPTLLLDKNEYAAIEKRPKDIEIGEKYILCYILGTDKHKDAIEEYSKAKGYKTVYFSDKRDSSYGVEEFLYLVNHSQLICTDSFHACVFSIIFERPFVVFRRAGKENYMFTRIQNLIDVFGLKDREYDGRKISEDNLEINYEEVKILLEKERAKSLRYLKDALEGSL